MASQFKGKVAIVTGSSAGLGEAIALLLASRGAQVTLCGRDKDRLNSVVDKVVAVNGGNQDDVLAVPGDLKDPNVQTEIIEQTVKKFGCLDILVANAGVSGITNSFLEDTEETYDTVLDTNLKSVFFIIQKAVPHLEKTKGSIVNVSSILSTMAVPCETVYSLSKAALDHLTRCLAVDLGAKGIRVNSINPGFFPTQILRFLGDVDTFNEKFGKFEASQQPLKGRIGVLDDVAETVAFLVSDEAGFITGEHIRIDGGRSYVGSSTLSPEEMLK
uniref:Uncharacterized protein n=1 Tax=Arion vulgaris TaxID=1028688 RepID=A0A0B7B1A6_9EUPU